MPFASSCILCPHLQQCALRFHLPDNVRRRYEVSTFHAIYLDRQLRRALNAGENRVPYRHVTSLYPLPTRITGKHVIDL
jgi:hypothetical protein